MVLLDTYALFFWTIDPARLFIQASKAIDAADRLMLIAISVWEIALKVKRARLEMKMPLDEFLLGLQKLERLEILSVDAEVWVKSVLLEWDHRDPADRVIVSTAALLNCPLVTSDRIIGSFYPTTIW
jgi:PIN domain nuclease of toxin-antitoxin system